MERFPGWFKSFISSGVVESNISAEQIENLKSMVVLLLLF